jgi:hypothetical protein
MFRSISSLGFLVLEATGGIANGIHTYRRVRTLTQPFDVSEGKNRHFFLLFEIGQELL